MAISNIREYLIERLMDLDPTLSSRQGSLMFVKVIDPLISRLGADPISVDVESFITTRLKDEFPDLDVASPGSALRDVLVNPLILLLEPIRREVDFLRTQQSLADQSALSTDEMDAILANVFSERRLGDYARGSVRVFFSSPTTLNVDPSIRFTTSDGKAFVPEDVENFAPSDYLRSGSQYYLDIFVRSADPASDHNVQANTITGSVGLINVVRVTNMTGFSGGVSMETNEEFLERAERSLSERSLNTKRGIETALMNSFADILSIDVVGFGEEHMQRDILQGEVSFDLTESTGPMSYMTADWSTHDVLNPAIAKYFPFTNTVVLHKPLAGWSARTETRIKDAKYIRIADGTSEAYEHRLLGRVRPIAQVTQHVDGDYYIKTSDFDVYPAPSDIFSQSTPGNVNSNGDLQGLNPEASQGSAFKLYSEVDGKNRVIGAHLPYTDVLETNFVPSDIPGSVIKGRDFLVVADEQTFSANDIYPAGTGVTHSKKNRTYPLTRFFNSTKLGVGRVDSFLISKPRFIYKGSDDFTYEPKLSFSALNETPKVIDFGAPSFSKFPSNIEMFDGETVEESGRNPGATLEGKRAGLSGIDSVPNPSIAGQEINSAGAPLHEADIILKSSQKPWDERGVIEGMGISCTLYGEGDSYSFNGETSSVDSNIVWQGTGLISKVGEGDRWRLRVRGLDWTSLESGVSGFAPSASATVGILDGLSPDEGGTNTYTSDSATWQDPAVPEFVFKGHHDCNLNYSLIFDSTGDGVDDTSLHVSVLDRWLNPVTGALEPSSSIDTRSTVTVAIDDALYAAPGVDFRLSVYNAGGVRQFKTGIINNADVALYDNFISEVEAATVAARIVNKDPQSGSGSLIEPNSDSLIGNTSSTLAGEARVVLRSMVYGNLPADQGWTLVLEDGLSNPIEIPGVVTIADFTSVQDRTNEAIAGQFSRQANWQNSQDPAGFPFTSYVDTSEPTVVRFSSTDHGSAGNGTSVNSYVDPNPGFEISKWDGMVMSASPGVGNINGGFSAGFGPMIQVMGIVPDAQLTDGVAPLQWGLLDTVGYENLTTIPPFGGSDKSFVMTTENSNLAYKRHEDDPTTRTRIIIEFNDDGSDLRFVLDDDGEGYLTPDVTLSYPSVNFPLETFSGKINYARGLVTITVTDSALEEVPATAVAVAAYSYYLAPYKLCWTVYRGSLEVLDAYGNISESFDELVFAPAMKSVGTTYNASHMGYDGDQWHSDSNGIDSWATVTDMSPYGGASRPTKASWVRLGRPFNANHPSIGSTASGYIRNAELTRLDLPLRTLDDWQPQYLQERFGGKIEVVTKTSLPFSEGTQAAEFDDNGELLGSPYANQLLNNTKGSDGFLIPSPMGTGAYADYPAPNPIETLDALEHQIVQLFEGVDDSFGDTRISISGIPGGLPFEDGLEVESGSVHLGGMTDIYVKPNSVTSLTTPPIRLSPSSPETTVEDGGDILIQAEDGIINPSIDGTHFYSSELEAALTNEFGPAPAYTKDCVLELIEPPSAEVSPTFVRIIHSIPSTGTHGGGCKIDGAFPGGLGAGFENIKFRVVTKTTTSLVEPLMVIQQGSDLSTTANSETVRFSGGLSFSIDPENVGMFLSIDGGSNAGEYVVESKNLSTLTLSNVINTSESGLSYRVYMKQSTGVRLPLVRVSDVSLSGDAEGVKIPYALPVDSVATAFSGLNDDPINEDVVGSSGGTLLRETVEAPEVGSGVFYDRCTFEVAGIDFKSFGIIRYDVLVLSDLDGNLKHWYVDDFIKDPATSKYSKLLLDRHEELDSPVEDAPFTIGKPSIGNASILFSDRTFFEVTQDTVFCYENPETGKKNYLRPSPAESALIFANEDNKSSVKIYGSSGTDLVSTDDFFKHGVMPGDKVRIVSRTIQSNEFDGSDGLRENENLIVAGKTMAFKVENQIKSVTFSGPNPVTLDSVASDINQQLGLILRAEVGIDTRDNGFGVDVDYYRLMIHSSSDVEIISQGSIGVVETLKFSSDMDNTPSNDLIDVYEVDEVLYTEAAFAPDSTATTTIRLKTDPITGHAITAVPPGLTDSYTIFIEIIRDGNQRVYPAGMELRSDGLYSAPVKLTSYDPNTSDGIVPDGAQLEVSNFRSLGYKLVVKNSNYSFSVREEVDIEVSAVVLHDSATSFENVYEASGADVNVTYDTSGLIGSIQNYVLNPNVRVLCNNPLVRHFLPAYPLMEISYGGKMSEADLREGVSEFFASLYPNRPLDVFELQSLLSRMGVTDLNNPQEAAFIVYDADRNITLVRNKDRIVLNKLTHVMEDMSSVIINKVG